VWRSTSLTWNGVPGELLAPGTYDYFAGGSGRERTLRASVRAWQRYWLAPRVLRDGGVSWPPGAVGTRLRRRHRVRDLLTGMTGDLAHVMALAGARSVAEIPEVTGPPTGNSLDM
jgi:isopentenyl diphosphate isomerase/L-lactate dehydrogenase-like FMN-dependent dehydrogenase